MQRNSFKHLITVCCFLWLFTFISHSEIKAQKGKYFTHYTYSFLCGEVLYFYNDSLAFYDEGCENHAHSISILRWKRVGNTITLKAIENGYEIAIRKVEKFRGDSCNPVIEMFDIDNKPFSFDYLFFKEGKWFPYTFHPLKNRWSLPSHNFCYYRNKKYSVLPDNIFPLYCDELKIVPGSPYNRHKIYFNLPELCLGYSEWKTWCYPEIQLIVYGDKLLFENAADAFWTGW